MTQQEFEAYVRIYPRRLNIWYSDTAPYTVLGVSIPTITAPPASQDISSYIETLTKITIPLTTGGSTKVTLLSKIRQTVPDPSTSIGTSTYYLCTVAPVVIAQPTGPLLTGAIEFSPAIIRGEFINGPYDVLLGNVEESRTSGYIMQSDRYKIGTLDDPSYTGPINIELLLASSASKADVQDSLYSDTGWTNARYEGSTTDKSNYGITPAESGRVFKGAFYPKGIPIDQIKFQVSGSQAIYEDFFYAGIGTTPGVSRIDTGFTLTGSFGIPAAVTNYAIYDTSLYLKFGNTFTYAPPPLKADDLIYINSTATPIGFELLRVITAGNPILFPTFVLYNITVTRNYQGDQYNPGQFQNFPANTGATVEKATLSTISKLVGNKLQPVPEGNLVIKESGAIVQLDPFGVIIKNL